VAGPAVDPGRVMGVLAALAPEATGQAGQRTDRLVPLTDMERLPLRALDVFEPDASTSKPGPTKVPDAVLALADRARLRADGSPMRLGWLWVTGKTESGNVRFPLVSVPVEVVDNPGLFGGRGLRAVGDVELTDHITDPAVRTHLEANLQFGGGALHTEPGLSAEPTLLSRLERLAAWAAEAAEAAGFPAALGAEPPDAAPLDTFAVVAQLHAYLAEAPRVSATIAASLQTWSTAPLGGTVFATIYCGDGDEPVPGPPPESAPVDRAAVDSSIVLSAAQRAALAGARTDAVTVISGPPGTGKSQTLAAIALDAVERGQSVLIAAPSEAAVEALITLLTEVPGPDPLVFGANVHRHDVADRLGQGGGPIVDDARLHQVTERHRSAQAAYQQLYGSIRELLVAEQVAAASDPALTLLARQATPNWFAGGISTTELAEGARLLARARHVTGLFAGYRRARRLEQLQRHAGTSLTDFDELAGHLATARSVRAAFDLTATGGLDLEALWPRLVEADEARRRAHAAWLNAVAHSARRIDRRARGTMAAVAAAIRAGRASRREMLARIDGAELTRALPLWIGTLRDVDDLLPSSPGMFDLVIVDEGSQVDQVTSAPALVRGRRAVVAGDPKQLRHVSFLSDARIRQAVAEAAIADPVTAGRLDVRRLSAFDLAASVAPVHFLDEHFRSLPHLVAFSAERFYAGRLAIATRHPANDDRDCISVRFVTGARESEGANPAELDVVLDELAQRRGSGSSVGVVSPFRAHVDALEARLTTGDAALARELDLRIGTVHGFQGCERDVLVVSLAVGPSAPAGSLRFLADENLFNVMITRARHEIVVITSLPPDTSGLTGDYLRHADAPPAAPASRPPADRLARAVAADLARSGAPVATGYPAGRHTIDLVVGAGEDALGVLFGVHPDGPDAHIDRRLALTRAGWHLRDAYATRWQDRPEQLAVELALEATRRTTS
jgi:hypothetical protein